MSWLFGSKKKAEEPPKPSEPFVDLSEEIKSYSSPVYPKVPDLPYPVNSGVRNTQNNMVTRTPTVHHNPLDSIPFKICSSLQSDNSGPSAFSELGVIRSHFRRVTEDLNSASYYYDFKVEKNVIQEANFLNGCH